MGETKQPKKPEKELIDRVNLIWLLHCNNVVLSWCKEPLRELGFGEKETQR